MRFHWIEFLRLAKELIRRSDEASLRSGISRAYYGVFCIARNRMGLKSYKKPDVHRTVISHYQSSSNLHEKYVGRILDELRREQRNDADYDQDKVINHGLAQRIILKAENALKRLGVQPPAI